ncbi:PREDICTED: cilia- and flagella-associated protein 69 isoform X2 [Thamnophis sirtalis]|uniref:Cilia- and flagella-associated protein 69 isoform X2 n=1 Tax=Thamnophis sirtalis TaxID=35019 RepID=A0A6I9YY06_9SAUR|nr:PREDICTED: cilia- and flagella-associated protein 69 isoform X2 [Thamnophis sirtalis]
MYSIFFKNIDEQIQACQKVAKHYEYGIPLNDLALISKILNLCVEKIQTMDNVFIEITCVILKLYGLPFYKKKLSDEEKYAKEVQESIAQLGHLVRVPCSQIRIQICKCIISFYHAEPSVKEFEGYQPTSANYKKQIVELGGLAETMVLSLTLVENQLSEKLWFIKTLQHLSISEANCKLMMKAEAPRILCSHLNDVDPSGQLLFRSSEILWNLLEKTSKEQIIEQLSNLECVQALKDAFTNLLIHGFRHYDRQLRNDILVIATLVAQNPGAPMIETGFTKQLILYATFDEMKTQSPLVKGLKLTSCYEDFELKKLLLNMLTVLAKDLCSVQLLHEGNVILALFNYLKPNEKGRALDMSAAQYEELQLLGIATLATMAPLLIEDYMLCKGNEQLLEFLKWCVSNDPFFTQGNSFHGVGGRGTKLAQMRFCLRVLNPVVSLADDAVNVDLCGQGAINQLLGILKFTTTNYKDSALVMEIQSDILLILSTLCENNIHRKELFGWEGVDTLISFLKIDAKNFYSGLGHNRLLFCALDCLWCCVMGCTILEDYFLEKEGLFTLLDLLLINQKNVCNLILGILVEFCDNPKTVSHINIWRGGKNQTAANLLINLWRQEEEEMGVKHDKSGRIVDTKKPLVGQFQKTQEVIPMPANHPTIAVMDVAENMRAKIYCLICKLGFENLPGLSARDFVTLAIIRRYLDFKIHSLHKQREIVNKSWENFLARTSNYQALKAAKRLQEKAIENSRPKIKHYSSTFHPTDIKGLNTTVASGRLVTVESTPSELIGGPLADTDLALKKLPIRGGALKKFDGVKVIDSFKKNSLTVK